MSTQVIVLEAKEHIGGRARAHECEGSGGEAGFKVDPGAMIITGVYGNPITVLCRQLGVPLHEIIADRCPSKPKP
jgi:phytoene dehydrogenase-like protein